jgi:L-threonylcarbamoyladenylate synthase
VIEPEVLTTDHPRALVQAATVLRRGGLIALPTDTVYGLAADAWNGDAITKLYETKSRSELKSIPVLLPDAAAMEQVVQEPSERIISLAAEFWPGPLTLVVGRNDALPAEISATPTVGVRAPNHEFALKLLRKFGPLATTSANLSGKPSSTHSAQVIEALGASVDLVVDGGETAGGVPSTVIDLTLDPPVLLRTGPIALEAILRVWESY